MSTVLAATLPDWGTSLVSGLTDSITQVSEVAAAGVAVGLGLFAIKFGAPYVIGLVKRVASK